jgi:DNA-binding MarR family transcriptional regulator
MSKKKFGSLQSKVLIYVAENPETNIQEVQFGLNNKSYGAVHNAIMSLEKKNYLKTEEGLSKINIKIDFYSCTEKGVFYALSYAKESDLIKILEAEKDKFDSINYFISEYERMGEADFIFWFRDFMKFVPMLENNDIERIIATMIIFYSKKFEKAEIKERVDFIKNAMKNFPSTKKAVDELREIFNKIDEGEEKNN